MKTELAKLIDKWEIEKGSYIPNAPIYQAFIDEAKEALDRESQVNNIVLDYVNNGFYCYDELVNNMLEHDGGKCKEQCKSCINDMQEKWLLML